MRALLLTRYDNKGASSRVRFLQYLPFFITNGFDVEVSPLFSNAYLDALYAGKKSRSEILKGYLYRLLTLFSVNSFDLVIVEKEIFPFLPAFAERILKKLKVPCVVDYDDAIFHRYDIHQNYLVRKFLGRKIDVVMFHAVVVIAGNRYLAERALLAGAKTVVIIPTVVDTERYVPLTKSKDDDLVIGWIGTPKTSKYLIPLIPIFRKLREKFQVRIQVVGARELDFDRELVEVVHWTEETEVACIHSFDIGIMPLDDTGWERGKCGYKLIQYMACGLPVVASPVGVNNEIVQDGVNGYLASSIEDWEDCLIKLCISAKKRKQFGQAGRLLVEEKYSIKSQQDRLMSAIMKALSICVD